MHVRPWFQGVSDIKVKHPDGGGSGNGAGAEEQDFIAPIAGSDRVVGIDDLLNSAENFRAGVGGFMAGAYTRPLLGSM
jgi:hypothetical protein